MQQRVKVDSPIGWCRRTAKEKARANRLNTASTIMRLLYLKATGKGNCGTETCSNIIERM